MEHLQVWFVYAEHKYDAPIRQSAPPAHANNAHTHIGACSRQRRPLVHARDTLFAISILPMSVQR
jgi:hypothetical protein